MENLNPLRILFVEDLPSDAALAEREIRKSGLEFISQRVETKDTFLKALAEFRPEIIVSDYSMPEFNGMQALKLSLEHDSRIPFILLTGSVNEETAVECMKAGAWDYVIKESMSRLPFAVRDALEQKRIRVANIAAEHALRESEERYRLLAESSPEMIYLVGRDGRVTYVNSTAAAQFCMNPKEFIGKHLTEIFPPGLAEKYVNNIQEVIDTKRAYNQEIFQKFPSGEKWVETRLSPVIHESGEVLAVLGLTSDITERKLAVRLTESLYEMSKAINSTDNLNELFRHIHRVLSGILQAKNFFIALLTADGKALSFPFEVDEKDTGVSPAIEVEDVQSLTVEVLKTKRPLLLDEAELLDRYATGRNRVWGTAPKCWLGVPLVIKETVIGVMAVQDYQKSGSYSQKDVTLFESAARQIAIAIERKRAEDAIRESEHRNRTFLDATTDMAFLKDDKFRHLFANRALCKFYGKTENEILRKKDFSLMSGKAALRCRKTDEQTILSNALTINEELIGDRCYETVKFPVEIADGKVGVGGYIRDITERKRAEDDLRHLLAWQDAIFEGSRDAIFVSDVNSRLVSVNQAACILTGYSKEELLRMKIPDLHEEEDLRSYAAFHDRIMGGDEIVSEAKIRQKAGKKVDTEFSNKRVVIGGVAYMHTTARDISERKRTEETLRESEEDYRRLFEDHAAVKLIVNPDTGSIVDANAAAAEYYGWSREELKQMKVQQLNTLAPEQVLKELSNAKAQKRIHFEFQHRRADGSIRDVQVLSSKIRMRGGEYLHSIIYDITERKQAEKQITLLAHTVKSISECVSITDLEDTVIFANAAFLKTYGYDEQEILGKNIGIVRSPNNLSKIEQGIKSATLEGGWQGELLNRKKDGREFPVSLSTSFIRDDSGQAIALVGVATDITERKKAEESRLLLTTAIESSTKGVVITDLKGSIVWVNKAFTVMTGYPRTEAMGQNLKFLKSGKQNDSFYKNLWETISAGNVWAGELINKRKDGSLYSEEMTITPVNTQDGKTTHYVALKQDITGRKKAELDLRSSEERFRSVWDNSADGMRLTDREGRIIDVNAAFCKLVSMSHEELLGKTLSAAYQRQGPDDDLSLYHKRFDAGETVSNLFVSASLWNGESIDLHISSSFIETADQERLLLSLFRDVTEQRRSQNHLEEERTLLRTIIDAIPDEICVKDSERRFVLVNPGTMKALKRSSEEEVIGKRDEDLIPEKFALLGKEEEESALKSGRPFLNRVGDSRINPVTGEIERSILISKIPLKDSSGKVFGLVGINRDITEVQQANASLEKERTLLLTLIESIPDEICLKDTAHRYVIANSASLKALGVRSMEDLLGKTDLDYVSPELAQRHFDEEDAMLESGQPMINFERTRRDPVTGEIETCKLTTKVPVMDHAGKKIGILVVNRYITERKKAEEALRASDEKFRALFEESKDLVYFSTAEGRLLDINAAGIELLGYATKQEMLQIDLTREGYVDGADKARFNRQMAREGFVKDYEVVLRRKDGGKLTVLETATAVMNSQGKIMQYRGIMRDVTQQRVLERQFVQAQKMESIGTLAGGIAHDFNNILGIILGHIALLERVQKDTAQFEESIFSINKAVERGASLVRQILTFARKTETQFEPVNINSAIKELVKMLEVTFPKTMGIAQKLDKAIPVTSMDPSQLHQTLLNLCVNARDAMNGQGILTLTTHLVLGSDVSRRFPKATAHHYVQVSVKDTGTGMDEETRQHIFEPFFTTKEKGKGTGLGLAVVYGVVQAHSGFIDVESAPGAGTTFHLFFPVPEGILTTSEKKIGPQEDMPRGTETILVVEDEDVLRDLLAKLLEMQGYTVIAASDGEEAVRRFGEHAGEIALVLSDMGLPKRSGWDALRMMQKTNPNVRALLASGYVEPGQKSEILKSGVRRFISKPYRMEEVLKAIRETLDEKE